MNIRIDNVKLNIFEKEEKLLKIAEKKLGKPIKRFEIIKKSLDARDKNNIFWVYSIAASDELPVFDPFNRKRFSSRYYRKGRVC